MNIGMIGMSKGNGHPYSWSAIINGYDKEKMEECEYKTIPKYLKKYDLEKEKIERARVTHIWTQNPEITKHIADTTFVENRCKTLEEMVGKVDAVILARDDYENHMHYGKLFIKNGIPIYIDKPIATNTEEAKRIFNAQKYKGQIFTCSSIKYAKEFSLNKNEIASLGKIKKIRGKSLKDWEHYAIHIIEPTLNMPGAEEKIVRHKFLRQQNRKRVTLICENGLELEFETTGKDTGDIQIGIEGTNGKLIKTLVDPFHSFKGAIEAFIDGIEGQKEMIPMEETLRVVGIIEMGK